MPNLTDIRFTNFDYEYEDGAVDVISVGISLENTLIISVPASLIEQMDEQHIVLLAFAIAKRDLNIEIDETASVIMNVGDNPYLN